VPAPKPIVDLVDRFHNNREAYKSGKYNEAQVRQEFIDPMFRELGWDMDNTRGYAEQYKEVVHEDAIKIGVEHQAPDYCFRIGGTRKFFLEAKKPSVWIKEEVPPAYQLRRYAWSAKLPLSILTDFEEFAVYDCRQRPLPGDKPSVSRIEYYTFEHYGDAWDKIAENFHRESVLKGSFDKYADSTKKKKGTTEVDAAFLDEIESWRDALARNIAARNPEIEQRELNDAVQRTIDRIVFLRICEDRGIEPYGRLKGLIKSKGIYEQVCHFFKEADARYNSGLFHFQKEKDRQDPDTWTLGLRIDDAVLADMLKRLYYPESPYEFSVLPADILGQVYEQFLGKVIRLTKGHQAKVEEKPEVRKAGGVYYTPTYIVDYIVKNTLGKLLENQGLTPRGQLRAVSVPDSQDGARVQAPRKETRGASPLSHPIRVLDPACGSGSFLLVAYQYLLDWYREQYTKDNPEQYAKGKDPKLYQAHGGDYHLTLAERKRILLDHIYGVDIDTQAVEVTKLSLLLKVLEGESAETIGKTGTLFHERALPDLHQNIKCGNSLVGPDFFKGSQMDALESDEIYRVNVFDWKKEFKGVFVAQDEVARGFDIVIGNPPYIRSQLLDSNQREYFRSQFKTATLTYDIYVLFVERATQIANAGAQIGYILPNKFFTTDYGAGLRHCLSSMAIIDRLVDFQDGQVFAQAGTYTTLLILDRRGTKRIKYAKLGGVFKSDGRPGLERVLRTADFSFETINIPADGSKWTLASGSHGSVLLRLQERYPQLLSFSPHIFQGLKTSADKVYMVREIKRRKLISTVESLAGDTFEIEAGILQKVAKGESILRHGLDDSKLLRIIYPYEVTNGSSANLMDPKALAGTYPLAWKYLLNNKLQLGQRDNGIWSERRDWYAYARSQNIAAFVAPKHLIPYMTNRMKSYFDSDGFFFVNISTGGYGLRILDQSMHPLYLSAIFNSRLMNYCVALMTNQFRGGYFAVNKQALERLPLRPMNGHSGELAIISFTEKLQNGLARRASVKTDHDKKLLQRQIESTDAEIDRLVYELYGLTEDEIRIVEEKDTMS
jgi:hypothetical protein